MYELFFEQSLTLNDVVSTKTAERLKLYGFPQPEQISVGQVLG